MKKKQKNWIEINAKEKYVIFEDNPKKKVPIKSAIINLDMNKSNLHIEFELA